MKCIYGERCKFVHISNEELMGREMSTRSMPRSSTHKTELCRNWDSSGYCSYGMSCKFAHGQSELEKFRNFSPLEAEATPTTSNDARGTSIEERPVKKFKFGTLKTNIGIYGDWI
ncbi:uncharacterized protein [Rutidosis leptorrhynchoides]|uniref:uncharacterized protein n=1 Tax=Rutidosis leptorrhynchoides TaxID=125765 RepID=UPI003A9A450D